jgi:uncharacterized protein
MKVLAFADTHGSMKALREVKEKAAKADLLLCCGDLTIFEQNMEKLLLELSRVNKPVLILPGNHEPTGELKKRCSAMPNLVYMENRIFETDTCMVFGSQGNGFAMVDRNFEKVHKAFEKALMEKSGKSFILMTHAPPFNTALDELVDGHCGNKSIRDFIKATKPHVAFAGHIHENAGRKDRIGNTLVINPGPYGVMVSI